MMVLNVKYSNSFFIAKDTKYISFNYFVFQFSYNINEST